jgi:predicted transcriptional regulator
MGESDEFWSKVSYVEMSKNRKEVVMILSQSEKPMTPSELSEEMDIVVKSASRSVRQLAEKEIVECINPDAPRFRRYKLTSLGQKISEEVS